MSNYRPKKKDADGFADLPRKTLSAGAYLFLEGDPGSSLYLLTKGQVEVFKVGSQGEKVLANLGTYQILGEMSVLHKGIRMASVRALEDCEFYELPGQIIRDHLNNQPLWFRLVIESLLSKLNVMNVKTADK